MHAIRDLRSTIWMFNAKLYWIFIGCVYLCFLSRCKFFRDHDSSSINFGFSFAPFSFFIDFLLLLFSCLKHPFVANISNVLIECLRFLSIRILQPNIIVNCDVVITSLLPVFRSKIFLVQTMMDFLLLLHFHYVFALLIAS